MSESLEPVETVYETPTSGEGWDPIYTDDPEVTRERNPHERALCYWFMCDPENCIRAWSSMVSGITNPGAVLFQDERNRLLVQKIIKMHKAGVPAITMVSLKEHCSDSEIESFGGWSRIVRHFEFMLTGGGFYELMESLLARYRSEEFCRLTEMATESLIESRDLNAVIAMVNDKSRNLLKAEGGMITPTAHLCVEELERKIQEEDSGTSIPTTFRRFAEMVGEYQRGQITLVGAPPGNGKTAWAMQEIQTALDAGFTVDAFLMESSFKQYTDRYISRNYLIHGSKFKSKFYTQDDYKAIHDGMERVQSHENRFYLAPMSNYSPADIDALIQARKANTGLPCDFIVIDHLDCMTFPRSKGQGTYDAKQEGVLALRSIAARENAALLLCSQLSVDAIRNSVGQGQRFPTMDAFRGGTPTEAAKVVVILNKDKQAMVDGSMIVEQQIVICKANDGQTGFVRSLFIKPLTMHIEDNNPEVRARHARWINAIDPEFIENNPRRKDQ